MQILNFSFSIKDLYANIKNICKQKWGRYCDPVCYPTTSYVWADVSMWRHGKTSPVLLSTWIVSHATVKNWCVWDVIRKFSAYSSLRYCSKHQLYARRLNTLAFLYTSSRLNPWWMFVRLIKSCPRFVLFLIIMVCTPCKKIECLQPVYQIAIIWYCNHRKMSSAFLKFSKIILCLFLFSTQKL